MRIGSIAWLRRMRLFRRCLCCLLLLLPVGSAAARNMKLTIYDDGVACPAGCDAHVVFNATDNATVNAHMPGSRSHPVACRSGQICEICFDDTAAACMTAMYRGGGPPAGTFDFTPAFYDEHCGQSDAPTALRTQCASLDRAASRLGYDKRTNCFETPQSPKCVGVMKAAKAARDEDVPKRAACLKEGESAYNRRQTSAKERRTDGCNYSLLSRGGSATKHWHLLMPAACRDGTFVDRFGLDCCSKSIRFAAANGRECIAYFPH